MIAQITGTVVRTEANSVVLEAGGIGYQLYVPVDTLAGLPAVGEKTTLQTHLVLRGQPDVEMTLYGFRDADQVRAFKILLSTSGVGPKVALALLSTYDLTELSRALSTNDTRTITRVPGVGPKLAARLCLELGDKMAAFSFLQRTECAADAARTVEENTAWEDAVEGLISLGYSRPDSRKAVDRAAGAAKDRTDVAGLLGAALKLLTTPR